MHVTGNYNKSVLDSFFRLGADVLVCSLETDELEETPEEPEEEAAEETPAEPLEEEAGGNPVEEPGEKFPEEIENSEEREGKQLEELEEPAVYQTTEEAFLCLHDDVHFLVNDFLPFSIAVLVVFCGCHWFYRTFCR